MRQDYAYGANTVIERDTTVDLNGTARLVTAAQNIIREQACGGLTPPKLAAA